MQGRQSVKSLENNAWQDTGLFLPALSQETSYLGHWNLMVTCGIVYVEHSYSLALGLVTVA